MGYSKLPARTRKNAAKRRKKTRALNEELHGAGMKIRPSRDKERLLRRSHKDPRAKRKLEKLERKEAHQMAVLQWHKQRQLYKAGELKRLPSMPKKPAFTKKRKAHPVLR